MHSAPDFMSILVDVEPKTTGMPGLTNWVSTIPARSSAVCMASTPARVTGPVEPAIARAAITIGCRALAYTIRTSSISVL